MKRHYESNENVHIGKKLNGWRNYGYDSYQWGYSSKEDNNGHTTYSLDTCNEMKQVYMCYNVK